MVPFLVYLFTSVLGYQRLKQNVTNGKADNHEGFDFYAPVENPDKSKPLWGENQWPDDDVAPGFKDKFELWIEKMKRLGLIVMEALVHKFGLTFDFLTPLSITHAECRLGSECQKKSGMSSNRRLTIASG